MAATAKVIHQASMRATLRAKTASTVRAASAAAAIQSGSAASSETARCGSIAMKAAASASWVATCTKSAADQRTSPPRSTLPLSAKPQITAPATVAAASHSHRRRRAKRIGGACDDGEIDNEGPRVGLLRTR